MNNVNERIMERLRKVLNLAQGKNATQGEMEAAMARAKAIALEHNIDLATVELKENEASNALDVKVTSDVKSNSNFERPYHRFVFSILRKVFGVHVIIDVAPRGSRRTLRSITLVGEATDVAIAKEVFMWLQDMFPKVAKEAIRTGLLEDNASSKNGCYSGLHAGIIKANKREEDKLEQDDKNKFALVVRKKEDAIAQALAQLFPNASPIKRGKLTASEKAFVHGFEKGNQIKLNQLGGAQSRKNLR